MREPFGQGRQLRAGRFAIKLRVLDLRLQTFDGGRAAFALCRQPTSFAGPWIGR
jgi:hypothetical protein